MRERGGMASGPADRDWTRLVRGAFANAPSTPDDDVVEELAQHARAMYEAARAEGCSEADADRQLAEQLDRWRAEAAALRRRRRRAAPVEPPSAPSGSRLAGLVQEVRYAVRLCRREPRHALLTIVTAALSIAATTVLFSVVYGVLMKPLPWPNRDRLVDVRETRGGNPPRFGAMTNAAYLAWREGSATLEDVAAWSQRVVTLSGRGSAERIRITAASPSLFHVLGVSPLAGALFREPDEKSPVVVLSESLWRERFEGRQDAIGRLIELDGRPHTVVGVLPDRFAFPDRQARAFVPYAVPPATGSLLAVFHAVALLRDGTTTAAAAAEGTARGRSVAGAGMTASAIFGSEGPVEIAVTPLREAITADVRRPLILLLIAVALLLATATANVATLQLARGASRSREMAIRAALGAGGARVRRQLLIESLVPGLAGGALGLLLATVLHRALPALMPAEFPRRDDLSLDAAVVSFAILVTAGTSIVVGLLPSWHVRRLNLVQALSENGAEAVAAGAASPAARARTIIMAGQVAIACVLLVGASLLGRSFVALLGEDRGFDPAGVLAARVSMPEPLYPTGERRFALVEGILERLERDGVVAEAGFTSELPLTPGGSTSAFTLRSPSADGGVIRAQASPRVVSAGYFSLVRQRVVSGRAFSGSDTETSTPVVVVNETFARRYLGDSPVGSRLPIAGYGTPEDDGRESVVVGVVEDIRYPADTAQRSLPELYYSHRQMRPRLPVQTVSVLVRPAADPGAAAAAVRAAVRAAEDRLVPDAVIPLEQRLLTTLARPRLYFVLLTGFALFSLMIAGVGLFGLLSYTVSQRARELALRAALGAGRRHLFWLVLRQGLGITSVGLLGGLLASIWLTDLWSSQLHGVSPRDTLTFIAVPLLLLGIATLACLLPARRAARRDPLPALRG